MIKSKNLSKPKIIAIVGPTASGKTSLSISLARKFNGEIISADSRQVYKGLDIGSGKVTKHEMRGVAHYMLDVASPRAIYTVAQFQKQGREAIKKILAKNKLPIIVGGTGLYVDALIHRYTFPAVKPNATLRRELEKLTTVQLFTRLKKLDPRRAKNIDAKNPRRLLRALEIVMATNQPVPSREEVLDTTSDYNPLILGTKISDKKLRENIHARLIARLKHGMIREVENLHKNGLSWARLESLGLEYRYIARYLQDKLTKKEMAGQIEKESWRFSRRQITWFRKNQNILWISNPKPAIIAVKKFTRQ